MAMMHHNSPLPPFLSLFLLALLLLASILATDAHYKAVCHCYKQPVHNYSGHDDKGGQSGDDTSGDNSSGSDSDSSSSSSSPSSSFASSPSSSSDDNTGTSDHSSSSFTSSPPPSSSSSSSTGTDGNKSSGGGDDTSSSLPSSSSSGSNNNTSQSSSSGGKNNRGHVGVCFGQAGEKLPPPSFIVELLKSHGITKVRLFIPIPSVLNALNGTGIKIMVGVPNNNIAHLSTGGVDTNLRWLKSNILAFVDPNQVTYLAVDNEILIKETGIMQHLVPAMNNLYKALQSLGLQTTIKLSSPCGSQILSTVMPPSAGAFSSNYLEVIRPLLKFLSDTEASIMVNLYPFLNFIQDPKNVPLNFCLFKENAKKVLDNGMSYFGMFDVMVDALLVAIEKEGFSGISVMVTGTGWPTAGNFAATTAHASDYIMGVMERVLNGEGTPKRPNQPVEVYLSSLFNANIGEQEYEKHYGLFNFDGSLAVQVNVSF
ncbi:hypothetical protein Cni_G09079 [Canna indica]|uniref:Glucan endo-1,3-beta-D-glucosidase n=1 Tax=Canna indica TaxID=4628 RepID=A0AAQ3Q679_9LILI|nr:hypothetical protein Cni_G09079 [Canna indica]